MRSTSTEDKLTLDNEDKLAPQELTASTAGFELAKMGIDPMLHPSLVDLEVIAQKMAKEKKLSLAAVFNNLYKYKEEDGALTCTINMPGKRPIESRCDGDDTLVDSPHGNNGILAIKELASKKAIEEIRKDPEYYKYLVIKVPIACDYRYAGKFLNSFFQENKIQGMSFPVYNYDEEGPNTYFNFKHTYIAYKNPFNDQTTAAFLHNEHLVFKYKNMPHAGDQNAYNCAAAYLKKLAKLIPAIDHITAYYRIPIALCLFDKRILTQENWAMLCELQRENLTQLLEQIRASELDISSPKYQWKRNPVLEPGTERYYQNLFLSFYKPLVEKQALLSLIEHSMFKTSSNDQKSMALDKIMGNLILEYCGNDADDIPNATCTFGLS